jgi:hypothetical protein
LCGVGFSLVAFREIDILAREQRQKFLSFRFTIDKTHHGPRTTEKEMLKGKKVEKAQTSDLNSFHSSSFIFSSPLKVNNDADYRYRFHLSPLFIAIREIPFHLFIFCLPQALSKPQLFQ